MQKAASDLAPKLSRLAFVSTKAEEALTARDRLIERYGNTPPNDADAIVAVGGDGLMLRVLHRHLRDRIKI
jgi:NAD+ kinase